VYVAAAEAAYEEIVRRVRLVYLPAGLEVVWEPEREDVKELRRRLITTVAEIEGAAEFPATVGPQCNWCAFRLRCRERTQVMVEELVAVEGPPFDDWCEPALPLDDEVATGE
jgi:CRISPR/Cas system-associated exonuclease Cas4 (RecB family)